MPKTKQIEVSTTEEVTVTSYKNRTIVKVDDPDVNELLSSIDNSDIITYMQTENIQPEDLFTKEELAEWASENGYIKE